MLGLHVTVMNGPDQGQEKTIRPPGGVIGRATGCVITLTTRGVSHQHARLASADGKQWTLQDLGSTNGTFVNDTPVRSEPVVLPPEGSFRLGIHQITFKVVPMTRTRLKDDVPDTLIGTVSGLLKLEGATSAASTIATSAPGTAPISASNTPVQAPTTAIVSSTEVATSTTIQPYVQSLPPLQPSAQEQQLDALLQERNGWLAEKQKLERDVDGMKRTSETHWKENQALRQQKEALSISLTDAEKQLSLLRDELAMMAARVRPLEQHMAQMREKYTIMKELNEILSKPMSEVHREGRLLNALWREAGILRVHNSALQQQNLLLNEQLAVHKTKPKPQEAPPSAAQHAGTAS